MAGAALTLETGDLERMVAAFSAHLRELPRRARRELLDAIGVEVEGQTKERFDTRRAPDGSRWQPLSRATKAVRRREGSRGHILVWSGDLRGDVTHQVNGDRVQVGAAKKYAAVHQYGHTFEDAWGRGFAVTVPARPYLGLSDRDEDEIGMTVEDFAAEYLGAAA